MFANILSYSSQDKSFSSDLQIQRTMNVIKKKKKKKDLNLFTLLEKCP